MARAPQQRLCADPAAGPICAHGRRGGKMPRKWCVPTIARAAAQPGRWAHRW